MLLLVLIVVSVGSGLLFSDNEPNNTFLLGTPERDSTGLILAGNLMSREAEEVADVKVVAVAVEEVVGATVVGVKSSESVILLSTDSFPCKMFILGGAAAFEDCNGRIFRSDCSLFGDETCTAVGNAAVDDDEGFGEGRSCRRIVDLMVVIVV